MFAQHLLSSRFGIGKIKNKNLKINIEEFIVTETFPIVCNLSNDGTVAKASNSSHTLLKILEDSARHNMNGIELPKYIGNDMSLCMCVCP